MTMMNGGSNTISMELQQQLTVPYMASLLHALTQPDTQTIRQAEQLLKPLLKEHAVSMQILWQICSTPAAVSDGTAGTEQGNDAVRHVAAIVLRKRLPAHYVQFDGNTKVLWQQQVLQAIAVEQVRAVRAGLLGIAAILAQQEGVATQPYLQFLSAAATDANPAARELCFLLLQEMTDSVGMHWKEHLQALYELYAGVLHNPNEPTAVHKAAVRSLGQLMSFWAEEEDEIRVLAPLLPALLQVASTAHEADEDFLAVVLDILYDLSISHSPPLQPHMAVTVQFALHCLQNRQLELRVRDAAALVIATTAESKPKSFGRHTALLCAVLDVLFDLMETSTESAAGALFESNPAWRADLEDDLHHVHQQQQQQNADGNAAADDDDDFDSPTETSMAQGTLDMLACEIPKKFIWQPALQRCLDRMANPHNAAARKAGVAGLGVIAEGCCDPLTAALPTVMPYVFAAAQDMQHPQVRECACFCLGQISEHCQPDILQYASQILPTVFTLLDDKSVAVQATSCYVLEMFCERLEPDAVRPLLDSLVRKLAQMLEVTTKRSVQEMAVAALAATAVAAEEEFTPYVPGVAVLMGKLICLTDHSLYSLRGRALECMGHMAIAVGRDVFRPYFAMTMQSAMEGLTPAFDSTDLQEFAYAVFANLAKVMKEEFAPALPELVPHLIRVIDMDEGQLEQAGGGGAGDDDEEDGNFGGLDDSDDDEDGEGGGNLILHVRTALLEVKKGAITALGEMAAHTGTNFCPHLQDCLTVLQKAATNWHPLIKGEVADALPSLIIPSIAAYHNGALEWRKGDLPGSATATGEVSSSPLSQHTAALVQAVLQEEMALMKDEDKATVGKACEAVQAVLELTGPYALAPVAQELFTLTHDLLTRQAPCQLADEGYGELPDEDDDHDAFLQATCGLVGAFCRVMGNHFAPYLPQFLPAVCEYAKSSRPANDRSMAMGCLSDIAEELEGVAFAEYWPTVFLPAILAGLADADETVRRNSAFCTGICCERLRERAVNDYSAILQQLGPVFAMDVTAGDAAAACVDNAAAALARMIMASAQHVTPMSQVLPVLLRSLPLKTDMTENGTVYTCLMGLWQMKQPDLVQHVAELERICRQVCSPESPVDEEIQEQLKNTILQEISK